MKKQATLKELQSLKQKLEGEADALRQEITLRQSEYNKKLNKIKDIKKQIESQNKNTKLRVSEHALVRYFERVKGFNIKDIEDELLNENLIKMVETLGNGTFPNDNYSLVIKDNVIVTIK